MMEKFCKICGKKFYGNYQTELCENHLFVKEKCLNCGKEFDSKIIRRTLRAYNERNKFCCKKCAIIVGNKNKYKKYYCEKCGKEFEAYDSIKNILCKDCRFEKRICEYCKKEFICDIYDKKKFCCKKCANHATNVLRAKLNAEKLKSITSEEKKQILEKREKTLIERYGVKKLSQLAINHDRSSSEKYIKSLYNRVKNKWGEEYCEFHFDKDFAKNLIENKNIKNRDDIYNYFSHVSRQQIGRVIIRHGLELEYSHNTSFPNNSVPKNNFVEALKKEGLEIENGEPYPYGDMRRADMKIKNSNICIEVNPTFTHCYDNNMLRPDIEKDFHQKRSVDAENNNYFIFHLFDNDDFNKSIKRIKTLCNQYKNKIYGRSCIIKEIDGTSYSTFCKKYHFKGYASASIKLGLFYNDELVQIMSFSKPRKTIGSEKYDWELVRLCSKEDVCVVGGASKLFSYFTKKYKGSIFSFCDFAHNKGDVYEKLGFKYIKLTAPNYIWVKGKEFLPRYKTQKHKLKNMKEYDDNKTEIEIMLEAGYTRVFDSGNKLFTFVSK